MRFSTRAIHVGQEPDPTTGSITPPVYLTSTFALASPTDTKGYDYTRHGNPNYTFLEATLASLEDAAFATVFSSGMGAIAGATALLSSGDRVVALNEVYGGTYRLFVDHLKKYGIDFVLVSSDDEKKLKELLAPPTKFLLFESPTNPRMQISDIAKVSKMAHVQGVLVIVDNTFASPYFQNPLTLGADVVWHSTTKYISGHSDLIGGVLITNDKVLKDRFDLARLTVGTNPSPFDAWLTSRGVKTLAVRMEQHQKNSLALAQLLASSPLVKRVHYPGLPSHPGYEIAKKQMRGYSGVFSVEFNLSSEKTLKLLSSLQLFALGISLGGVESLVNHSATMSHAPYPLEERLKMGITDSLVRISAGIEDTQDLVEDMQRALNSIT